MCLNQQNASEHERYEELCALAAGGLLEGEEFADFQRHQKECSECRADYQELHQFVTRRVAASPVNLTAETGSDEG